MKKVLGMCYTVLMLFLSFAVHAQESPKVFDFTGEEVTYNCIDCDVDAKALPRVVEVAEVRVGEEAWHVVVEQTSSWSYEANAFKIRNYNAVRSRTMKSLKKQAYIRTQGSTKWTERGRLNIFEFDNEKDIVNHAVQQFVAERQFKIDRGYWKPFKTKNLYDDTTGQTLDVDAFEGYVYQDDWPKGWGMASNYNLESVIVIQKPTIAA